VSGAWFGAALGTASSRASFPGHPFHFRQIARKVHPPLLLPPGVTMCFAAQRYCALAQTAMPAAAFTRDSQYRATLQAASLSNQQRMLALFQISCDSRCSCSPYGPKHALVLSRRAALG